MAQQPNVELSPGDLPRAVLEPAPARRQRIPRPGVITIPDEMPTGPGFGTPGPDTGWALRIIGQTDLPEDTPGVRKLLAALMGARAAHFGRAPIHEDLKVGLALLGLRNRRSDELDARRRNWVAATIQEKSPGRTAVAEAGEDLYRDLAALDPPTR
jgi:hypothetical protein